MQVRLTGPADEPTVESGGGAESAAALRAMKSDGRSGDTFHAGIIRNPKAIRYHDAMRVPARLADLVQVSDAVRGTSGRIEKRETMASWLRGLGGGDLRLAAFYLSGEIPQRNPGVGRRAVAKAMEERGQASLPLFAAESEPLTLEGVDAVLAALATESGAGATRRREAHLHRLLDRASPGERSFLGALLVGELRQGALRALVLEALAAAFDAPVEDLRRAAMLAGGLDAVASALAGEGAAGLARFILRPLVPIEPMLAGTAERPEGPVAAHGEMAAEWKLDGVRIQLHKEGDRILVFTRRLRDITSLVPDLGRLGASLPAASCILDGELTALDEANRPAPFQDLMGLVSREQKDAALPARLEPRFFDCLFLDGSPLLDLPLRERRTALERAVPPAVRVEQTMVRTPEEARFVFEAALAAGHEGILLKDPASPYTAGRRGSRWWKVKPALTLDLVILAAEWGSGRRRGFLSNLHLGARDAADPERFHMLGKTFKGLTDAMLRELTEDLLSLETAREDWVVAVKPLRVVEIAFDGLQNSPRYDSGLALRFARVKRFRPDKTPGEAATIDEVREIHKRKREGG